MSSVVYWLRHKDHTDILTQGYVGVTNNLNVRLRNHKSKKCNPHLTHAIEKYGWENIIKQIIIIADEAYCLLIESRLRSDANIGWNVVKGGGKPPVSRWNKGKPMLQHVKDAILKANIGRIHTQEEKEKRIKHLIGRPMSDKAREALRLSNSNRVPPMKGKHFSKVVCPHCNKEGGVIPMKRWHMDNCKFKEHQSCRV